jgi:hypothetical protein
MANAHQDGRICIILSLHLFAVQMLNCHAATCRLDRLAMPEGWAESGGASSR